MDELRTPERVHAAADIDVVQVLRWVFESAIQVGQTRPDGRVELGSALGCRVDPQVLTEHGWSG